MVGVHGYDQDGLDGTRIINVKAISKRSYCNYSFVYHLRSKRTKALKRMLVLRGEHETYTCRTLKINVLFMECEVFRDRQTDRDRERKG